MAVNPLILGVNPPPISWDRTYIRVLSPDLLPWSRATFIDRLSNASRPSSAPLGLDRSPATLRRETIDNFHVGINDPYPVSVNHVLHSIPWAFLEQ